MRDDGEGKDDLASADERQTEKGRTAHCAFGVVQVSASRDCVSSWVEVSGSRGIVDVPVDSGIVQSRGIVLDEKISKEPACSFVREINQLMLARGNTITARRTKDTEDLVRLHSRPDVEGDQSLFAKRHSESVSGRWLFDQKMKCLTTPRMWRSSESPESHIEGMTYVFHASAQKLATSTAHQISPNPRTKKETWANERTVSHTNTQIIKALPIHKRLFQRSLPNLPLGIIIPTHEMLYHILPSRLFAEQ